jgi:hypothetical protein
MTTRHLDANINGSQPLGLPSDILAGLSETPLTTSTAMCDGNKDIAARYSFCPTTLLI